MAITAGNKPHWLLVAAIITALAGCGLTQQVGDSTAAVGKAIFYKQVRTLHLEIRARKAVNPNAGGVSLSTVVRIYQLKARDTFDSTDYPSLFKADSQALQSDLIVQKDIRLQPGERVEVTMPMDKAADYVAVAGMFIAPDLQNNNWRLVLSRDDLDPDKARIIEVGDNRLVLQGIKEK